MIDDARTGHGLDQICTDFARIRTDVHGRTDAARTLHRHFMVPRAAGDRRPVSRDVKRRCSQGERTKLRRRSASTPGSTFHTT